MTRLLLKNVTLVSSLTPTHYEFGWLLIEDSKIAQLGDGDAPTFDDAEVIDCTGKTMLPGFIDVHVHGAMGYDTMDATPEALHAMAGFYAQHGVTSFLATTMTQSREATTKALINAAECVGQVEGGATILGVHLEGPYLNLKMKGAQIGEYIRRADPAEYMEWLDLDVIKQVTVAPEFHENEQFIKDCVARKVVVSMGHTAATYEEVHHAVKLGARQATHTFNQMSGIHHRKPGTVGAVLTMEEVRCEVIADYIHLHPAIVKLIIDAKHLEVILITDAIRGAGMPDGQYELGGQPVTVSNNTATLADGTLAGSVLTLDHAFHNAIRAAHLTLDQGWPMSSLNAAIQLGIDDHKGEIAVGYDADIVLLDQKHDVAMTIAEGRIVYRAK